MVGEIRGLSVFLIKVMFFLMIMASNSLFNVYATGELNEEVMSHTDITNEDLLKVDEKISKEEIKVQSPTETTSENSIAEKSSEGLSKNNLTTSDLDTSVKEDVTLPNLEEEQEDTPEVEIEPPVIDEGPIDETDGEEEEVIIVDEEEFNPIIGDPILDNQPTIEVPPVENSNNVSGEEEIAIEESTTNPKNIKKPTVSPLSNKNQSGNELKNNQNMNNSSELGYYHGKSLPQTGQNSKDIIWLGIALLSLGMAIIVKVK